MLNVQGLQALSDRQTGKHHQGQSFSVHETKTQVDLCRARLLAPKTSLDGSFA